jgi:hypothetical protein
MKRVFFVAVILSVLGFPAYAEMPANSESSNHLIERLKEAEIKR